MKHRVSCAAVAAFLFLSGCQRSADQKDPSSGSGALFQVLSSQDGSYKFDVKPLQSLQSILPFKGSTLEFYREPYLAGGKLLGFEQPLSIFRAEQGYWAGKDLQSIQMITLYYNFEKLRQFDAQIQVNNQSNLDQLNSWPLKVFVVGSGLPSSSDSNALFSGQHRALLFTPYNETALPLMLNYGVHAHEHFHALFYELFLRELPENFKSLKNLTHHQQEWERQGGLVWKGAATPSPVTPAESYHQLLVRGVDEGLADLWGYILSQDENFVGRSLPSETQRRKITNKLFVAVSQSELERIAATLDPSVHMQIAYELGSQISKTLRVLLLPITDPKQKAQIIISAVVKFARHFQSLKANEVVLANHILELFAQTLQPLPQESCEALRVWNLSNQWGCL